MNSREKAQTKEFKEFKELQEFKCEEPGAGIQKSGGAGSDERRSS